MHFDSTFPGFRAKAVIDWIKIEVTFVRATRFPLVQGELHKALGLTDVERRISVKAQNVAMSGDPATVFVLRLQEQLHENNAAKIAYILHSLEACYGFAAPARTVGIEMSFDLWPRNGPHTIYEAAAAMKSRHAAYGSDPRQVLSDRSKIPLSVWSEIALKSSLYSGHRTTKYGQAITAISTQVYPKTTDGQDANGKPIPLPPELYRARAEVTLQLGAIEEYGLTDPLALASYDFTRIAGLLHFQMFKDSAAIKERFLEKYRTDHEQAAAALKKHKGKFARKPMDEKDIAARTALEVLLTKKAFMQRYGECIASGRASISRNTDMVIDWQHGWEGTKNKLQHSKDTIPDAKLNRKVKNALQALTTSMSKATYPPALKHEAHQ